MSASSLVASGPFLLAAPVAALAGLVSFASPCVLPLVPGYLSYVTGLTGAELRSAEVAPPRGRVLAGAGLFVLGFSLLFVSYGLAFGGLGQHLLDHRRTVDIVLGSVAIVLGLAFMGLLSRLSIANREWKLHLRPGTGLAVAPVLGLLFGLGWTPCVGPTLSVVQGLAFTSGTAGRGALLSLAYCLGLGVPFVLVALGLRRGLAALSTLRSHLRAITIAGGGLLVAIGVLEVTGVWQAAVAHLQTAVGAGGVQL
ncbi:MAG: cytochrome c biosis protein transrane region [Mycobacterium sp.]|jgi:cytochrome c-type biogenesis protein|nr:cytochrome c biosis protein transrane region [Mycobacterium sp.]MCW2743708.1 cytochrome c biosis protein transrane region [Mycobacterium sp.]